MAPPRSVLSTTLPILRDKYVDSGFLSHPLFTAIDRAGNLVKVQGGSRIEQPVVLGSHSSITQYSNGFEPMNMAITDPFQRGIFDWAEFSAPIVLSRSEQLSSRGDRAMVSILDAKMKNVMLDMKKQVSLQIFKGTSAILTDLQTLNGMGTSASAVVATGWLEGVAQASQVNTVGGLSKSTFQADGWYNPIEDAGGTLTLAHLDGLMNSAMVNSPSGKAPDMIFMSLNCYNAFLALVQNAVQYVSVEGYKGLSSEMVATWRGAKIYIEPNLGFTGATPAKAISAYALSSDSFALYTDSDAYFAVGDLEKNPGSETFATSVYCRMQLVTSHLASHGVLLDAEA
tara:strand:- start:1949 stop:2974 length:1026 start_codon:yes stop_codon:yes gene_type:complete